jgi:hypothetical protein
MPPRTIAKAIAGCDSFYGEREVAPVPEDAVRPSVEPCSRVEARSIVFADKPFLAHDSFHLLVG